MLDGLKEWLIKLIEFTFKGFDFMMKDAKTVLSGGLPSGVWETAVNLSSYLVPFCNIIIGICLLTELALIASKVDLVKWEHGLKILVKMVFAKAAISIAPTFLQACYKQAQAWVDIMASGNSIMGQRALEKIAPLIRDTTGIGNILGLFLSTFIVIMAILLCTLTVKVMAYGRMFEILVYVVVSPIPFAFFPLGNGDGSGFSKVTANFIKSFVAVCLQGVIMIIVIRVFDVLVGNAIIASLRETTPGEEIMVIIDLIFAVLLGSIALVMAITKSGTWAKNIINAM